MCEQIHIGDITYHLLVFGVIQYSTEHRYHAIAITLARWISNQEKVALRLSKDMQIEVQPLSAILNMSQTPKLWLHVIGYVSIIPMLQNRCAHVNGCDLLMLKLCKFRLLFKYGSYRIIFFSLLVSHMVRTYKHRCRPPDVFLVFSRFQNCVIWRQWLCPSIFSSKIYKYIFRHDQLTDTTQTNEIARTVNGNFDLKQEEKGNQHKKVIKKITMVYLLEST